MIATLARQQIGTVERALKIYERLGLVEATENGGYYMSNIELLIGQSSTEGERKKQARLALQARKQQDGQMSGHPSDIRPPEIELEIEKEMEIKRELEKGQTARAYGRYGNVVLSDKELSELKEEFPAGWKEYIERLSGYMESTGKKYKNHAATIRRWANADRKKAAPGRNRDYSVKEGESV